MNDGTMSTDDILNVIARELSEFDGCSAWVEEINAYDSGFGLMYTQLGKRLHIICNKHCVLELRETELVAFDTYVPGRVIGESKVFSVDINDPDSISKIAKFLGVDESKKKTKKMSPIDIMARIVELGLE